MPDLSFADVEARLTEQGRELRELGESLRHQRAAVYETFVVNWLARADYHIHRNTTLDAIDDAETYAHLRVTLAGELREAWEIAEQEAVTRFYETYEAGQR